MMKVNVLRTDMVRRTKKMGGGGGEKWVNIICVSSDVNMPRKMPVN